MAERHEDVEVIDLVNADDEPYVIDEIEMKVLPLATINTQNDQTHEHHEPHTVESISNFQSDSYLKCTCFPLYMDGLTNKHKTFTLSELRNFLFDSGSSKIVCDTFDTLRTVCYICSPDANDLNINSIGRYSACPRCWMCIQTKCTSFLELPIFSSRVEAARVLRRLYSDVRTYTENCNKKCRMSVVLFEIPDLCPEMDITKRFKSACYKGIIGATQNTPYFTFSIQQKIRELNAILAKCESCPAGFYRYVVGYNYSHHVSKPTAMFTHANCDAFAFLYCVMFVIKCNEPFVQHKNTFCAQMCISELETHGTSKLSLAIQSTPHFDKLAFYQDMYKLFKSNLTSCPNNPSCNVANPQLAMPQAWKKTARDFHIIFAYLKRFSGFITDFQEDLYNLRRDILTGTTGISQ